MTERDPNQPKDTQGKAAPETLELRARPQPVTRINRKVLIGGAALVLLFISGIVLVALKPPSLRVANPQELFNVEHKPITDGLSKLPATYDGVKPEKKVDVGRGPATIASGIPQLTEAQLIPSPKPSGSRRRASLAWPARPARASVLPPATEGATTRGRCDRSAPRSHPARQVSKPLKVI